MHTLDERGCVYRGLGRVPMGWYDRSDLVGNRSMLRSGVSKSGVT